MFTRRALDKFLNQFLNELIALGINPEKVFLFGSYVKGGVHEYSDIDIAVWSHRFIGEGMVDFEIMRPLIRKYKNLDVKMYPLGATADNFDPFISIIENTGRKLDLPSLSSYQAL
jgi:predicted nucleotidyltransferase